MCTTSSCVPGARSQIRTATRSIVASKPLCVAGPTGCARRSALGHDPALGRALFARYRDAFPIDYREVYPSPSRSAISASSRGSRRSIRSASIFTDRAARRRHARASKCSAIIEPFRSLSACRCWKIWASASSTNAPTTSSRAARRRSGSTTWSSKAPPVSRSISLRSKHG